MQPYPQGMGKQIKDQGKMAMGAVLTVRYEVWFYTISLYLSYRYAWSWR